MSGWRISRVKEAPAQGHGAIFRDRQAAGVDVGARIAPVEIVPGGVVAGMLAPPIRVRRQRQDAAQPADRIIGGARGEEGAVPAIVLDDEDAHQQGAGRDREQQRHQIGKLQRPVHQRGSADEQADGAHELEQAERYDGFFVRLDCDSQIARIRHFHVPARGWILASGTWPRARAKAIPTNSNLAKRFGACHLYHIDQLLVQSTDSIAVVRRGMMFMPQKRPVGDTGLRRISGLDRLAPPNVDQKSAPFASGIGMTS